MQARELKDSKISLHHTNYSSNPDGEKQLSDLWACIAYQVKPVSRTCQEIY
jgi:hypothetical protein